MDSDEDEDDTDDDDDEEYAFFAMHIHYLKFLKIHLSFCQICAKTIVIFIRVNIFFFSSFL